jgi:hypothetical protein
MVRNFLRTVHTGSGRTQPPIQWVPGGAPLSAGVKRPEREANYSPVAGLGGLLGCEMLRIPHCLDSRLTDGGKVSPTEPPHFTPQKHYYFYVSGTHFC